MSLWWHSVSLGHLFFGYRFCNSSKSSLQWSLWKSCQFQAQWPAFSFGDRFVWLSSAMRAGQEHAVMISRTTSIGYGTTGALSHMGPGHLCLQSSHFLHILAFWVAASLLQVQVHRGGAAEQRLGRWLLHMLRQSSFLQYS